MKKPLFLLFCILFLGLVLRFLWLDRIPHSINADELHYILNAKAFVLTGYDATKAVTPLDILTFRYPPGELVQAELMYFFNMLTVGYFPFSLFGIALPSAILSFLLIPLTYLITKKLFNQGTALVAAFLTAINPWFIAEGRTTYEMVASSFFYMSALYVMLITKGWRILLSLPLFILAFYSYIATKTFLLPTVIIYSAFCYFAVHKKQFLKQYLVLIAACVLFIGFFVFRLNTANEVSRMSELLTPAHPQIAREVDYLRKNTMNSPLLSLVENKITVFNGAVFHNFFEAFSLSYLFLHGDYFFAFGRHGLMYLLDPLFLFIGAAVLFNQKKKHFLFLIAMCAATVLPQIIQAMDATNFYKGNFSPHTTVLISFLIILVAVGIWESFSWFKNKKMKTALIVTVIGLYGILLINFFNLYFFLLPLQHNFYNLPSRLTSVYAKMAKSTTDVTIYTIDPQARFKDYLFYTNTYSTESADNVTTALQQGKYISENVKFVPCDRKLSKFDPKKVTIVQLECAMKYKEKTKSIVDLSDSGAMYNIINDRVCKNTKLKPYLSGLSVNDFAIDTMTPDQFCKTFITQF